ncbi:GNAT family N-acetyltransferase [Oceanirhabdus seepicola]|uniref:GNAT family N-acetyltransferase n=1 Tax=Oceanirhabdus seepicola TaxID=2828781 RepID=A0A9J6P6Z3_9CLOT|nr:GNAT family protein [Oceanirhabdus seepicola]MCM1991886.1 GNAT family N-acetyltransferase [Oceanirhabdus seepicola]
MPHYYGDRIVLREYRQEDFECIRGWVNDPEITANLSDIFIFPHTASNTEAYMNFINSKKGLEKTNFIIANKDTQEYIGQIDLIEVDWRSRFAVLGIVIGTKGNRGKGYGSEAIKVMQHIVFNVLNLNRLELEVHDYNKRAIRCYEKCGFKEEGRLKEKFFHNGEYTDYLIMSILKSDYDEMNK